MSLAVDGEPRQDTLFPQNLEDYDGCEEERDEHERYCVQKLDEDVQAGTSSVLPRVTHSVSHNSGCMSFCVLTSEVSHLYVFFRIVHCRSTPHHHDRKGYRGNRSTDDQCSDGCPA